MKTLMIENEENAMICLRILFDVHKSYSDALDAYVQVCVCVCVCVTMNVCAYVMCMHAYVCVFAVEL
jgi:hypothetical protein